MSDALPLFWEFYSGGGVICGASMHYDWNSFIYVPILLEAVALLPINCTLDEREGHTDPASLSVFQFV